MKKTFPNMGKLLLETREKAEKSLKIMANDFPFTAQFIHNIEKGKANMPIHGQKILMELYGVDLIDLQAASINDFIENYNREVTHVS